MNVIKLFFKRKGDVDDLINMPNWRVGLSSCADWSWGVSMAVGMGIMKSKGICPFLIWCLGNILAIPLMGAVRKYLPESRNWPKFTLLLAIFFVVEFFAIAINLTAILAGFGHGSDVSSYQIVSWDTAVMLVSLWAIFIAWYVQKGGLKLIMLTDLGYYAVQMLSAIFIAIMAYRLSDGRLNSEVIWTSVAGMKWALSFGFLGIITGVLSAGHQWQKFTAIDEKNAFPVAIWGGFFFGVYMVFVFLAGLYFTKNPILGWSFLVIMVALATSTIDSAMSGMGFTCRNLFGKRWQWLGIVISLGVVVFWFLSEDKKSVSNMWSTMAGIRYPVVLFFIFATIVVAIFPALKNRRIEWLLKKIYLLR